MRTLSARFSLLALLICGTGRGAEPAAAAARFHARGGGSRARHGRSRAGHGGGVAGLAAVPGARVSRRLVVGQRGVRRARRRTRRALHAGIHGELPRPPRKHHPDRRRRHGRDDRGGRLLRVRPGKAAVRRLVFLLDRHRRHVRRRDRARGRAPRVARAPERRGRDEGADVVRAQGRRRALALDGPRAGRQGLRALPRRAASGRSRSGNPVRSSRSEAASRPRVPKAGPCPDSATSRSSRTSTMARPRSWTAS